MMPRSFTPLQEQKRLLRADARNKGCLCAGDKNNDANQLADVFLRHIRLEQDAVVAGYRAVREEINPAALCEALRLQGHKIALPVIVGKREPLIFRLFEPGDQLIANPWGLFEPSSAAEEVEPDVLLIPLLAFDSMRNRLGYGGGYYDRTIKSLRARKPVSAIGIAHAYQEVAEVPTGPNDVPMDKIVTERGVI